MKKYQQPYFYWHLELSSKCSLKCPRCPRTMQPDKFNVTELTLDFIKKVFTTEVLSKTKRILLCGGEGDPIYCKEILDIIKFFKDFDKNIQFIITTNGSYKTADWWKTLANILTDVDTIIFSVDGYDQESNDMYRVNSNYASILTGIKTVSSTNPHIKIQWATILFSFNENKIELIKQIAKDHGVHTFNLIESMSFGSKDSYYIDKTLGYDPLEPSAELTKFSHHNRNNTELLNEYIATKNRKLIFDNFNNTIAQKYNEFNKEFDKDILPGCLINERGLYVTASGIIYPCSWMSHPFNSKTSKDKTKTFFWKDSYFVKYNDDFNLHKKSVFEILDSDRWQRIYQGFGCQKSALVECEKKCMTAAVEDRLKLYNINVVPS